MCFKGIGRRQDGSATAPENLRNMPNKEPFISQNENKHFKEVSIYLCWNNVKRVILAQLNVNSLRNKFDLLSNGIVGNVDALNDI